MNVNVTVVLYIILTSLIAPTVIYVLARIDKELFEVYRKKELLLIYFVVIVLQTVILMLVHFMISFNILYVSIIINYLTVVSYTDEKLKQIHRIVNMVMVCLSVLLSMLINPLKWQLIVILCIYALLLFISSYLGNLGFGDIFIFISVSFFFASFNYFNLLQFITILIFHMSLSVSVFGILNFTKLIKHDKEKRPYALSIFIAFYIALVWLLLV